MARNKINPLPFISDQQWLSFIALMTENSLVLNNSVLTKAEIMLTDGGHYPAVYFRLTSIQEGDDRQQSLRETSGLSLGFDLEWDEDVIIQPLTPQGYMEDWLKENGITSFFTYHDVGLRKMIKFLEEELKLWEIAGSAIREANDCTDWREISLK